MRYGRRPKKDLQASKMYFKYVKTVPYGFTVWKSWHEGAKPADYHQWYRKHRKLRK